MAWFNGDLLTKQGLYTPDLRNGDRPCGGGKFGREHRYQGYAGFRTTSNGALTRACCCITIIRVHLLKATLQKVGSHLPQPLFGGNAFSFPCGLYDFV